MSPKVRRNHGDHKSVLLIALFSCGGNLNYDQQVDPSKKLESDPSPASERSPLRPPHLYNRGNHLHVLVSSLLVACCFYFLPLHVTTIKLGAF